MVIYATIWMKLEEIIVNEIRQALNEVLRIVTVSRLAEIMEGEFQRYCSKNTNF